MGLYPMSASYRKKEQAWVRSGARLTTGVAGSPASRAGWGVGAQSLSAGVRAASAGGGAAPAPPTADRLPSPRGAPRHTPCASLIGSSRKPRLLSCRGAGFSVAAIFVDVSAPRGFEEAEKEGPQCRSCPFSLSPRTSWSAGPRYGEIRS